MSLLWLASSRVCLLYVDHMYLYCTVSQWFIGIIFIILFKQAQASLQPVHV